MKITLIAGARPNFMKIAPLIKAIKEWNELTNERLTNERLTNKRSSDRLHSTK